LDVIPYPSPEAEQKLAHIAARGVGRNRDLEAQVLDIIHAVREEGDAALERYTRRFDAPDLDIAGITVTREEIEAAYDRVDALFMKTLRAAISNIDDFHRQQMQRSWFTTRRDGTILGQMVLPVRAAGLYIPGGQGGDTPLISSVLMNGIPARIAGVTDIALATPPRRDGSVNPHLLVAAQEVGVARIHKVGSAWGIAALALGTPSVRAVDVIVGPGNIYVTLAKKLLAGEVGIDLLAGPSEILVVADGLASPDYVAADLLSQAEHDAMASAVLITPDDSLARRVRERLAVQLNRLPRSEVAQAALARYGAAFVVGDLDTAMDLANAMAPEHLELMLQDPWPWLGRVEHAGAVFLGANTPEPVGDYFAGPNHVLPTAGTARFSSALGVENFLKKTSVVYYSRAALERDAAAVVQLAEIEGLSAHAASVRVRLT
jgi:histidinol dehydrogenase